MFRPLSILPHLQRAFRFSPFRVFFSCYSNFHKYISIGSLVETLKPPNRCIPSENQMKRFFSIIREIGWQRIPFDLFSLDAFALTALSLNALLRFPVLNISSENELLKGLDERCRFNEGNFLYSRNDLFQRILTMVELIGGATHFF